MTSTESATGVVRVARPLSDSLQIFLQAHECSEFFYEIFWKYIFPSK